MFCCIGVAISKKDKKVKPFSSLKTGDKIHVHENKKVIKTVTVGKIN
tara:strand:+ start:595 stop:735 length:141 start_codon:yes stop_codon:yes gene_type:complete